MLSRTRMMEPVHIKIEPQAQATGETLHTRLPLSVNLLVGFITGRQVQRIAYCLLPANCRLPNSMMIFFDLSFRCHLWPTGICTVIATADHTRQEQRIESHTLRESFYHHLPNHCAHRLQVSTNTLQI